ncbi:MAG TPA: hypothetical protein VMT85_15690 [Thermoanaerobaculia bacterium]|nr:hypothetical protein [Thermoanaerobaculia bacterium]
MSSKIGDATLVVDSLLLGGSGPGVRVSTSLPLQIPSLGSTQAISVTCTPPSVGTFTATLTSNPDLEP